LRGYRRGEDVLTKNPEIVKHAESAGAMDSTLWLTTHKQFPENDNLVGMYQNGGEVRQSRWRRQERVDESIQENDRKQQQNHRFRRTDGTYSRNVWKELNTKQRI
jgi:hypothetical protein